MYLCNVSQAGDMKKLAKLLKLSFIVLGWIVFILLSYVAFKDEKTNVLITMKDSLRETINIDYQERLNKILVSYRPLGRKVKGVQIECGDSMETIILKTASMSHWLPNRSTSM